MDSRATLSVANLGLVDYAEALRLQTAMLAARHAEEIGDALLLMEHPHVFTLGRGADERFIVANPHAVPTYRVSRGGQVTYHGPGQLVGYPILKLEGRARDVSKYLRDLEQTLIDVLREFEIDASRRDGLTGVWVGARKISSIGVGIRRWTTYHGLAVNVTTDLRYFDAIVPCGIEGCVMTSVAECAKRDVSMAEFAAATAASFARVFGYESVTATSAEQFWRLIDSQQAQAELQR